MKAVRDVDVLVTWLSGETSGERISEIRKAGDVNPAPQALRRYGGITRHVENACAGRGVVVLTFCGVGMGFVRGPRGLQRIEEQLWRGLRRDGLWRT